MLLHRDGLIELNYDVTTDILSVTWPNMSNVPLSEIDHSINKLIDTLKHFDIKNLLIDGRGNHLDIPDEEHIKIVTRFATDLTTTRLKKIARIASKDQNYEKRSEAMGQEVQKVVPINFVSQTFFSEYDALAWLKAS